MNKHTPPTSLSSSASEVGEIVSRFPTVGLSEQTETRLRDTLKAFASYAQRGHRIDHLRDVDRQVAQGFIEAPTRDGMLPSPATMHMRRSALRLLFRIGRDVGFATGDPTLDIDLPPRSSRAIRPLADYEVALCRSVSLTTPSETRLPAAWALAESTATTAELGLISLHHVDLDEGIVRLPGSTKVEPRYGVPTPWGLKQLSRRMKACTQRKTSLLIYRGRSSAQSRQAAACIAVSDTLRRAGLGKERDVGPASVRAWAGVEIFRSTHSIDEVSRRLGMRSLDAAAELIGWNWRADPS